MYHIIYIDSEHQNAKTLSEVCEKLFSPCVIKKQIFSSIYEYTKHNLFPNIIIINTNQIDILSQDEKNNYAKLLSPFPIIFVSNHRPAQNTDFVFNIIAYILLTDTLPSITSALKNAISKSISSPHSLFISAKNGTTQKIELANILYIEIIKHGSCIYILKEQKVEKIYAKKTVQYFYALLHKFDFEYAHQSYIVNLRHIICIRKNTLLLDCEIELSISRSKKNVFLERIEQYWTNIPP